LLKKGVKNAILFNFIAFFGQKTSRTSCAAVFGISAIFVNYASFWHDHCNLATLQSRNRDKTAFSSFLKNPLFGPFLEVPFSTGCRMKFGRKGSIIGFFPDLARKRPVFRRISLYLLKYA
jgi:hypothetical protein